MSPRNSGALGQIVSSSLVPAGALGVLLLFLFAVQLLGSATDAAGPLLERVLRDVLVDDASALGLSWLGAYVLGNGSVIAALSLSLFGAGILSAPQLFLMVAGSRLGAAAIVLFIGGLDWLGETQYSLQESVSMGLLTFLLTLSIYLPVTLLGYVTLPLVRDELVVVSDGSLLVTSPLGVFDPVTDGTIDLIGPLPSFLVAVGLLFGSLRLFDRLLTTVDTATLRQRFFSHLDSPWVAFLVGLGVTGVTTSVAFSLGVIVPLYNRGYVKRGELIPYVLGANVGTLLDTLVVAVALGTSVGIAVVIVVLGAALLVTVLALAVHGTYSKVIIAFDDRLVESRRAFAGFLLVLVVVPLSLVIVPLVLA